MITEENIFYRCADCKREVRIFTICPCQPNVAPAPKISLDTYLKMQCDVACMLRSNNHSFCQASAKDMVDQILLFNKVEVDK